MSEQLSERSTFVWPEFWNFPPYFTLQPVPETQQKQKELWRSLIIAYCRHCRGFYVGMEDDFPPFANAAINRHLSREAKLAFLDHLVRHGQAKWLDPKLKSRCLILWRTLPEWASMLYDWAVGMGLRESVVTLDELLDGNDVKGSELEGLPRDIMIQALKVLESQGKARLFKGDSAEEGVKFF